VIDATLLYLLLTLGECRIYPSETGAQVIVQTKQVGVALSAYAEFCEIGLYLGQKDKRGVPIPTRRWFPWWNFD
jgi:hypothetical protein